MTTKIKTITVKAPTRQGTFEGIIEHNPERGDADGERIESFVNVPGKFELRYGHVWGDVGAVIGTAHVMEKGDDRHLTVLGQLDVSTKNKQADLIFERLLLPASDPLHLSELSVGFDYPSEKVYKDRNGVRVIRDATLLEVSVVHAGAQSTTISNVKQQGKVGLTKSQASDVADVVVRTAATGLIDLPPAERPSPAQISDLTILLRSAVDNWYQHDEAVDVDKLRADLRNVIETWNSEPAPKARKTTGPQRVKCPGCGKYVIVGLRAPLEGMSVVYAITGCCRRVVGWSPSWSRERYVAELAKVPEAKRARVRTKAQEIENIVARIGRDRGLTAPDVQEALRRRVRDSIEHDDADPEALKATIIGFFAAHTPGEDEPAPQPTKQRDPLIVNLNKQLDALKVKAAHPDPDETDKESVRAHLLAYHGDRINSGRVQRYVDRAGELITYHRLFHGVGEPVDLTSLINEVKAQKALDDEIEHVRMYGAPPGVNTRFDEAADDAHIARQVARENEERARRDEEREVLADERERGEAHQRVRNWNMVGGGAVSYYTESLGAEPVPETKSPPVNVGVRDEVVEPERLRMSTSFVDEAKPVPESAPRPLPRVYEAPVEAETFSAPTWQAYGPERNEERPETRTVPPGGGTTLSIGGEVTGPMPITVDETTVRVPTVNVDDEMRRLDEGETK